MTPKEYIYKKRQESGYFLEFSKLDKRHLKQYLQQLPTENDRFIAEKVWESRNEKTLSDIWDETAINYKKNLLIGLVDVPELKKIVDETYIGVLPTGKVNAFAGYAPNGERMIILNEGLLYTIHYWSSFFLRSLEEGNDDFFWKDEKLRDSTLKWIYSVWNNKLPLQLETPEIFPKNKENWDLAQILTFSSIVFVIAHEIGHVFHNHSGYHEDKEINHKMELDADMIALETTFKYSYFRGIFNFPEDSYFTKFMLMAPYLVLNILSLFDVNDTHTHPSVLQRISLINNNYEKSAEEYLGKERFELLSNYLDIDFFERLKNIGLKQLIRHIAYSKEIQKAKQNWI